MNLVIYRKYRPLKFEDIIGQNFIIKILKEGVKEKKIAHAYIFAGPRGTGKTTTARILAKAINCLNLENGEPCNKCEICKSIDNGKNLDIIEIDAASNRGIDEIRSLKENIKIAPLTNKYKVYIIDEAHMITKEGFNALLKTLEEPPNYVIFILATTEIEKIPITIKSRTQQFYFKKVSLKDIIKKLSIIVEKENIQIDKEALELIASSAEGSFRDAESLLDQIYIFKGKIIKLEDVENILGKISFDKLSNFVSFLLNFQLEKALNNLNLINENGYNLSQFTKDLIQYLRRIAVLKYNPLMFEMFKNELSEDHLKIIFSQTTLFKEKHLNLIKNLITAYREIRYSQFPIIPLEIAIIESLK